MQIPDWFGGPDEEITDDELRAHLASKGLDPRTQPAFCVTEVANHWSLPIAEAQGLVSHL
jgi:hypothetical protein